MLTRQRRRVSAIRTSAGDRARRPTLTPTSSTAMIPTNASFAAAVRRSGSSAPTQVAPEDLTAESSESLGKGDRGLIGRRRGAFGAACMAGSPAPRPLSEGGAPGDDVPADRKTELVRG